MAADYASLIVFFLFPVFFAPEPTDLPQDVLALVAPGAGLELLGEENSDKALEALITFGLRPTTAVPGKVSKEASRAISNLASKSEKVKEKARDQLVAEGEAVVPKLREVVKTDERRAAEAKKVIALIEAVKTSGKHDKLLAQQFAIRFAAENKKTALVPSIRSALASENMLVRLAAEDALRKLDKTFKTIVVAPVAAEPKELRALSKETRALLSWNVPLPKPGQTGMTMQKLAEFFRETVGDGPSEADMDEAHTEILGFVKQYGNIRPERIYAVNVGKATLAGGLGLIVRGYYEPKVLTATLSTGALWTHTELAGYTVYNSPFARVVMLSDRSVLVLPVVASATFPIEEYLTNLKAGKDAISASKRFGQFVTALEDDVALRLLTTTDSVFMEDIYANLEGAPEPIAGGIRALQDISIMLSDADETGEKIRLRMEAKFENAKAAKGMTDFLKEGLVSTGMMLEEAKAQAGPFGDSVQTVIDLIKGVKVNADGQNLVLRVTTKRLGVTSVLLPIVGVRSSSSL